MRSPNPKKHPFFTQTASFFLRRATVVTTAAGIGTAARTQASKLSYSLHCGLDDLLLNLISEFVHRHSRELHRVDNLVYDKRLQLKTWQINQHCQNFDLVARIELIRHSHNMISLQCKTYYNHIGIVTENITTQMDLLHIGKRAFQKRRGCLCCRRGLLKGATLFLAFT
ncbi:hypothetical protein AKJ16_DCAP19255 [Drosera capensis]